MKLTSFVFLVISAFTALAQAPLTNDSIIKMSKAGLGEEVILSSIKAQPGYFTTSADDLIALKAAGVTDKVIEAMITKAKPAAAPSKAPAKPAAAAPAPAPVKAPAKAGPPDPKHPEVEAAPDSPTSIHEVGVYYLKGKGWTDLRPEPVSWKTGGVLKSIGTAGLVKEDKNGAVPGTRSETIIDLPVSLVVYVPEGVNVSEYQLLHLHVTKDSREFRIETGGVIHKSGGATKDTIEFNGKKIADRTYEIVLHSLAPGEYALMPPGLAANITKLYTFHVRE